MFFNLYGFRDEQARPSDFEFLQSLRPSSPLTFPASAPPLGLGFRRDAGGGSDFDCHGIKPWMCAAQLSRVSAPNIIGFVRSLMLVDHAAAVAKPTMKQIAKHTLKKRMMTKHAP